MSLLANSAKFTANIIPCFITSQQAHYFLSLIATYFGTLRSHTPVWKCTFLTQPYHLDTQTGKLGVGPMTQDTTLTRAVRGIAKSRRPHTPCI